MLYSQIHKLKHFFHDTIERVRAPEGFVTRVMVQLEATIYDVGDRIVRVGDDQKDLIFIVSGSCQVYGLHTIKENMFRSKIKNLKKSILSHHKYVEHSRSDEVGDDEEETFKI